MKLYAVCRIANGQMGAQQDFSEMFLFANIIANVPLGVVAEIGLRSGGMFYLLSWLSENTANLISIDDKQEVNPEARRTQLDQCIVGIKGDSHKQETIEKLITSLGGRMLDLLFIDGDHEYEGVKADYNNYSNLVAKGGLIVFHDIYNEKCDVPKFWNEVKQGKIIVEIYNPHSSNHMGIGIIFTD